MVFNNLPSRFPELLEEIVWEEVRFICDTPGKNDGKSGLGGGSITASELVKAIETAKESLTIQSPYLVVPDGGIDLFKHLIQSGVKVRVSTNSLASTDNLKAFSGYSKQKEALIDAGIEIFEFKPDSAIKEQLIDRYERLEELSPVFSIHAKTLVIDGETLFVGTFNLDPRSANLNTEIGVFVKNKKIAGQVKANIEKDMQPENSWNAKDAPDSHASFDKRLKLKFWKMLPLKPLL